MAQPSQQTHFNTGCCFTIKHSDTCQHLKEGTLLIATAVATITIIGGVLGVLALNGVNLGALNSIAMAGEKYIYLGLAAGTGLLLIDTALIASLTRSYYNKQYTQKEIDRMGLQEWLEREDVLAKLEPGHYWPLPEKAEQAVPATDTNPGRPAVWGYIVSDFEGNIGVYAFKTEEDAFAQINKLGYANGEAAFVHSSEYTRGYLATQIDEETLQQLQEFEGSPVNRGEYVKGFIETKDKTPVYCLRFNKNGYPETHFYKSKEARNQARVGLINRKDIEEIAAENKEEAEYLSEGSAWILDFHITVNKFGIEEDEEVQLYLVYTRKIGTEEIGYSYFPSEEAAKAFIQNTRLQDAKAAWVNPTCFPRQLIEENCNLDGMDVSLQLGQFACIDLQNAEIGTVFALKIKFDTSSPSSRIYFKTEEAREEYIQKQLANYTDIRLIDSARDQCEAYSLGSAFVVAGKDCFTYETRLHNKTHYALIALTDAGIKPKFFASAEARTAFLGDTWVPVNERFAAPGQFKSEWVERNVEAADLQQATEAAGRLNHNEHDYGKFRTHSGTEIHWLAYKGREEAEIRYFTGEGLARVLQDLDGASKSLPAERMFMNACRETAEKIQKDSLLDLVLSNEDDCWPTQETISERRVNILYTRTARGIEISYPEDLEDAVDGLNNVHAQINETGEYPQALGDYLNREGKIVSEKYLKDSQSMMLRKEFISWKGVATGHPVYQNVYLLQVVDDKGNHTVHYFAKQEARSTACRGLNNGFVRDRDIQTTAKILSQAVNNASGSLAVGHFYTVPYEGEGVAAIVSVTSEGMTSVKYVPMEKVEDAQYETYLANVTEAASKAKLTNNDLYKELDPIEVSTQKDYLGKDFDGTGKLKANEFVIISRPGYALLMWVTEEEKPAKRRYFLTEDEAHVYVGTNLKGFKQHEAV